MQHYVDKVAGALSLADAEAVGAFTEDALSEADAMASDGDACDTPAESIGAKPQ